MNGLCICCLRINYQNIGISFVQFTKFEIFLKCTVYCHNSNDLHN